MWQKIGEGHLIPECGEKLARGVASAPGCNEKYARVPTPWTSVGKEVSPRE